MVKKIFFLFLIVSFFFLNFNLVLADDCDPSKCGSEDIPCLEEVEKSCIKKRNQAISAQNTLSNQIKLLDSQIQLTLLKITQTENSIKKLESEINNLSGEIGKLDVKLDDLSAIYISQTVQNYKLQKRIPAFTFLVSSNLNNFLEQYKYVTSLQKNSQTNLLEMETVRTNYDIQKDAKEKKQAELEELQKTLASQKNSLNNQKLSKNKLLEDTKNDERKYQQLLNEAQSQLAALKNFSSSAGGSSCLDSSPGSGSDGNFYSQRDPRWCKQFIGNSTDTIGSVGCYINSIAMTFKKLGYDITPSAYAANSSNFRFNTAYAVVPTPPSGYSYQQVPYSINTIDNELKAGRYVIAQMRMSNISGMHFIVIKSGSNGNYTIHDPWFGPDLNFSDRYSPGLVMSLRLITK